MGQISEMVGKQEKCTGKTTARYSSCRDGISCKRKSLGNVRRSGIMAMPGKVRAQHGPFPFRAINGASNER